MAQERKDTWCNFLFAFRVLDTVLLVTVVAVQGAGFNYFFIDRQSGESLWYLLFGADILVIIAVIIASILSYKRLLDRFHAQLADVDIPHIEVPMYGILPFGYFTWALYVTFLTIKIVLFFRAEIGATLPSDGAEGGLLSSNILKLVIAAASVVFVLLVNTHHDAEPESVRSSYIADLCKGTTFDIMDTVAFLSILLPEYGLPSVYRQSSLTNAIITLACINLFLPTLALMKLSLSDFGQAGHPVRLELLYKTGRFFLIDLPYMIVRLYLWHVDKAISLFLMKNVLYVLVSLRYLVPEYIAVVRRRRQVAASEEPSKEALEVLPSAPPPSMDSVI